MRKEAGLDEWKSLYEVTTRIQQMKPWEYLWDMDLVGIQSGEEEDTVFYSVLGRGGECYGIAVYEGYEAFNQYLMLTMQDRLNLSSEYAMFNQKNLICYWGNREELTEKQRITIKELGYKYRGKNQWLYFLSFEPGFYPSNLSSDEVLRITEYMNDLELALKHYINAGNVVDFEKGNMFSFVFGKNKTTWNFGEKALPFTSFQFGNVVITDDELLEKLANSSKGKMYLEVDITPMGASVNDKSYERPVNPVMCLIADAKSEMIIRCEMKNPGTDPIVELAEEIIGFIFAYGVPKEIRISNIIIEAGLAQICEVCNIKLRRVKTLKTLECFKAGMKRFM